MQALHQEIGEPGSGVHPPMSRAAGSDSASGTGSGGGISDPVQLVAAGFHKPEKWNELLTANIPVPSQIQGTTAEEKRAHYAAFLASQLRVSYPTASVAQMVSVGELPVQNSAAVSAFLATHQADFSIAAQPVEQFIVRK